MAKLLSSWYKDQSLPESYIFPPDERPGTHLVPRCNTVPVIDLGDNRNHLVHQILKASQEFGLFQVVGHGVPAKLMSETMSVFKEFFEMPAEDKESLTVYSDDPRRCKLVTSSLDYEGDKIHVWRDILRQPCHPLQDCIKFWPQKPTNYREVVAACSIEVKKLALTILELLCEGLGMESGYFKGKLSEDLELGVISNKMLKGVEHRAVTNSSDARISAVFCINPTGDSIIEPAKSLVTATNPPVCRAFRFKEYMDNFFSMYGNADLALQPFKLER
ncbi:hypothetical protein V6N13_137853 [Hibiscus sabdariffa]|uniref:Non-haem dioxygenase N-terminal domain-containing protein n=1 Tax=Hibiscus sabdariffa TaxID=183260 RepID=A0ABR2DKH2_9ROSI